MRTDGREARAARLTLLVGCRVFISFYFILFLFFLMKYVLVRRGSRSIWGCRNDSLDDHVRTEAGLMFGAAQNQNRKSQSFLSVEVEDTKDCWRRTKKTNEKKNKLKSQIPPLLSDWRRSKHSTMSCHIVYSNPTPPPPLPPVCLSVRPSAVT